MEAIAPTFPTARVLPALKSTTHLIRKTAKRMQAAPEQGGAHHARYVVDTIRVAIDDDVAGHNEHCCLLTLGVPERNRIMSVRDRLLKR